MSHPTNSSASPDCRTTSTACGSAHMLYSATGDMLPTWSATAPITTVRDALGQRRVTLEGPGEVGQWTERDERQRAGVLVRRLQEGVDGVDVVWSATAQFESDVAHAVGSVDLLGRTQRQHERGRLTRVHPDVLAPAQVACVQRVLHTELERHVAGDDADPDDVDLGVSQCDDERHCVVGAGVGVDEERPFHRAQATGTTSPGGARDGAAPARR